MGGCKEEMEPYFSLIPKYNNFYNYYSFGRTFTYQVLDETSSQPKTLIIINNFGDYATYFLNSLSAKNPNNKLELIIYPNPVKNEILISSFFNLAKSKIKIFDINGKLYSSNYEL